MRYHGVALPIVAATCDGNARTVKLDLLDDPAWRADRLAQLSAGRIEFLARSPSIEKRRLDDTIGPPFLQKTGCWGAVSQPAPSRADQDILTEGIIQVGHFTAKIIEFTSGSAGEVICSFEAIVNCGAE